MRAHRMPTIALPLLLAAALLCGAGCGPRTSGPGETTVTVPPRPPYVNKLDRAAVEASLAAGRKFLLNCQRPQGNFRYMYDFVDRREVPGDNSVRQAGTLWGLASIHREMPTRQSRRAVDQGLAFFREHSRTDIFGGRFIVYPRERPASTGAVALVALALVEMIRSPMPDDEKVPYRRELAEYLKFLDRLRRRDGLWAAEYDTGTGSPGEGTSPYFNGESLLAYCKAARYAGMAEYARPAVESAHACYEAHVTQALRRDPDSDVTKGFYQWGTMAFYELYSSNWENTEACADYSMHLATWIIHTHGILDRSRNTAYAFEGLACAAEIARLSGDRAAADYLREVVDTGLAKLTSWQVGGPMPNDYLRENPTTDPRAVGGVMNGDDDPHLRIDVTQHQMHALLLARDFVYGP